MVGTQLSDKLAEEVEEAEIGRLSSIHVYLLCENKQTFRGSSNGKCNSSSKKPDAPRAQNSCTRIRMSIKLGATTRRKNAGRIHGFYLPSVRKNAPLIKLFRERADGTGNKLAAVRSNVEVENGKYKTGKFLKGKRMKLLFQVGE